MPPASTTTVIGDATARAWRAPDTPASLTRPNNATPYAAQKLIGSGAASLFKFTDFFRRKNSGGLLTSIKLVASVAGIVVADMGAVRAHLYNAAPAPVPGIDQADFAMLAANAAKHIGAVDFGATWMGGGTGSDMIENYGSPVVSNMQITSALLTKDLYIVLVATAAFTPKAQAIITPYVSAAFD